MSSNVVYVSKHIRSIVLNGVIISKLCTVSE